MRYFAVIEDGFAVRFPVIREDEWPAFQTVDQVAVPLEEAEHAALSSYMGGRIGYVNGVFEYRPDAYDKDIKWARIKELRDAAEEAGFVWDGSTFDSDKTSQSRIQGAAQLATLAKINNQPLSIEWTLMNNGTRSLSADDMIAVGMALGAHINEQHVRARQLREQIEAATTPEQVQAVRWVY